jgi:hypothetical protein
VWPDLLRALQTEGWRNYSLFLAADGLLIGYLECDDFDAVRARMALTDVNARWQAEMASLFDNPDNPGQAPVEGSRSSTKSSILTTNWLRQIPQHAEPGRHRCIDATQGTNRSTYGPRQCRPQHFLPQTPQTL